MFDGVAPGRRSAVLGARLGDAARAYERERYAEAAKILRSLEREAPGVSEVHELLGLTWYRMGRFKDARRELTKFTEQTGSVEQNPVLADCARALGHHEDVKGLWDELRRASPGADLVAEGRIVMAGSLADQGRLGEAVALMETARTRVKRPKTRHLRSAYVLADLKERTGDVPAARSGFAWLAQVAPGFADVEDRLVALG
ncbi:MAG: tetratricopeptide repeat protein [Actinobacteria bacterium]|nr:tetratricopeptide repeat protein [Actinomycetota bacterium]